MSFRISFDYSNSAFEIQDASHTYFSFSKRSFSKGVYDVFIVSQITKAPNIARSTYLNPKLNKQLNGRLIFILNEIVSVIFAYNDNGRMTVVTR